MLGTHSELINDPNGAYYQLVQLQEGANQAEEIDTSLDADMSMGRSESLSSSGSRPSFGLTFGVSGPIVGVFGPEMRDENSKRSERNEARKVSIRRLAYLNKPELPVLLLGSTAASVHGVTIPVFGLLLSTAIKIFYELPSELRKDSRIWALRFLVFGVIVLLAVPAQHYFFAVAGGKLIQRIRSLTFERVVHQEIRWFDDGENSRLVN